MANHDSKNHDPLAGNGTSGEPVPRSRDSWSQRLNLFAQTSGSASSDAAGAEPDEWEAIRLAPLPRAQTRNSVSSQRADLNAPTATASVSAEVDLHLAAARREIADRDAENVGLRGALGAAHQQLRSREAEIADLTTRLAVANATTHARQEELAAVALRSASGDEKLDTLERELRLMYDKLQRAGETAENRDTKIENLRATRATLEETLKARDRVIKARDEELSAGEQELQAYRDRIATHQKCITDRDAEIAMLSDQLLAHQERARSLDAEIGGREEVVAHQREKLAQRDEQLASLLATLDVVERTIASRPGVSDLPGRGAPNLPEPRPIDTPIPARRASDDIRVSAAIGAAAEPEAVQMREEAVDLEERLTSPPATDQPVASEVDDTTDVEELASEDRETSGSDTELDAGSDADADVDSVTDESPEAEDATEVAEADEQEPPSPSDDEPVEASESETTAVDDKVEDETQSPPETDDGTASVISATAFEDELYNLESAGDLFSQRPPPQPPIFRWWRDHQIKTVLQIEEVESFDDLLITTIARECEAKGDQTLAIWSLSGADAELELRIAHGLVAAGHSNFSIECLDDRTSWHEIRADLAEADGLQDHVFSLPASLASFPEDQQYDVFIADGSLAHVADLPGLFEQIQKAWKDDSVMLIGAVLGPSAVGSSPENIETIDRIWNVMPDRYMCNYLTGEEQTTFSPSDPPSDAPGNGGPLSPGSTPLLTLLLDSFCFEVFAAFGNLINAFVGPEIGLNFDPEDESCCSFIERFALLDEAQIDAGGIHPVHMTAVLRSSSVPDAIMLDNRTPERCLMLED
ncbi:MAG: hypothetical protein IH881_15555 [Myxococcales bacterium]|nr:hypothetical protein [Myxococcales bacterium]